MRCLGNTGIRPNTWMPPQLLSNRAAESGDQLGGDAKMHGEDQGSSQA